MTGWIITILCLLGVAGLVLFLSMNKEEKAMVKEVAKRTADVNNDGKVDLQDVKAVAKKATTKRGRPSKKYGGKVKSKRQES